MSPHSSSILLSFSLFAVVATAVPVSAESETTLTSGRTKPNVLFIAIDDLRPELGCYGAKHAKTPHLDRFAARSVRFDRAYCQQAICGPSRASVMTGLRPDTLGVHGNHTNFRKRWPKLETLPQFFRTRGYHAQSLGKIYHGVFPEGASKTVADTFGDPVSWSVPTFRPGPRYYYTEEGIASARESYRRMYRPESPGPDDWTEKLVFGLATEAPDVDDDVLYDGQVAAKAVAQMRALSKQDQPFFLAAGFIKPHSPYIAPKKYFDMYDPDEVAIAETRELEGVPALARHGSGELRRYSDQPKRGAFTEDAQRRVRHAYLACTSYIDAQIGRVLDELDRLELADDTIVVIWSDHGYHLGEKGLWGKTTNFELDTRVVLMARAPGAKGNGRGSNALVELVDVYPTIVELAGFEPAEHLEGKSFAPVLEKPERAWKRGAFSQYTRGKRRGYSVRSAEYRYTEWYRTADAVLLARELYDHSTDPDEVFNRAGDSAYGDVERSMQRLLQRGEGWRQVRADVDREVPLFELSPVFSHHMVLQRDRDIAIYGRAVPGTAMSVRFGGTKREAVATRTGDWEIRFPPKNGGPKAHTIVVKGRLGTRERQITIEDVLLGDVWICSGQSNMRWRLHQSEGAKDAIAQADLPKLRLLDFEGRLYPKKQRYDSEFLRGLTADNYYETKGWQRSTPETARTFSAVAYHFGRKLHEDTAGVPIGLIHNAIGGVPMEAYLPREAAIEDPELATMVEHWWTSSDFPSWCKSRVRDNLAAWFESPRGLRPHHPFEPGFLFEAGMRPLLRSGLRGFLWYQGESNATHTSGGAPRDPALNRKSLSTMIASWREAFGVRDLAEGIPFLFVQLPGMNRRWALFREVQAQVDRDVPNTEMAITLDVGHPTDVHPRRKRPVGERLARLALRYSGEIVHGATSGPTKRATTFDGSHVRIEYTDAGGLRTSDGEAPRGFAVAGKDRAFHAARARIDGQAVVVSANEVPKPVAIRYAFADDPDTNLINELGIPAAPFRSDDWVVGETLPQEGTESFEKIPLGNLESAQTAVGRFEAKRGHAQVTDRFAHRGSRCLHILGGADRRMTLRLTRTARELRFQAERWTRRDPFEFRIDTFDGKRWKEHYNGDREIRVGSRFLSAVRVALPTGVQALRFRVTSPKGSGLLIDDVDLTEPRPMRVESIAHADWTAPALVGKEHNPVTRVDVTTKGNLAAPRLRAVQVSLAEGAVRGIDMVRAYVTKGGGNFSTTGAFGKAQKPDARMRFEGDAAIGEGQTSIWLSVRLKSGVDQTRRIRAKVDRVTLRSDGADEDHVPTGAARAQRIGVAVRTAGQDNCHTYRIPGLATTNQGSLIAVYDNRYRGSGDLPGDIDVGMSRSTDGGVTWEPMRVIMDMGKDPKWRFDGIGDPAVLVDRKTGRIWVTATWSHGNRSWRGSGPGMKPEETGQFMLCYSDDDGVTWSKPINITEQIKKPEWRFVLQGPGKGITLRDGTLVFAAQYRSSDESPHEGKPFSTLIWSKDRGKTWTIGAGVKVDTTEAQLVELADGRIMINCRDNRGGSRSIYTTKDLGVTWDVHPTSRGALPEPVCMASLIRLDHEALGPLLVFSNPATRRGRYNMTLKVSRDDGQTWPRQMHTRYDDRRGAGYSCLTRIDDEHVGVLYEGRRELYFLRFRVEELVRD